MTQSVESVPGLLDATGGSVVAGRDARLRILAAAVFAVVVVSLSGAAALGLALAGAFTVAVLARLPVVRTLKRVITMDGFIVVMLAMLPFTVPGEPVFHLLGFAATREGFLQALTIGVKANAIVLMALALLGSMEAVLLARALRALLVPERLVHLVLFTVRYVDVLDREQRRLRIAMKARGFRPKTSWHTYRTFGYLVGMLLVRALERSERIFGAMKCRGFAGRLHLEATWCWSAADVSFALAGIALVSTMAALEILHVAG
ncbi:cobalt ECF transporter T component CbiQ [Rhodovulum sp. PH10]|uniref:cobalt ECF transporter T component CbiQ n=1 Tax=Rhodovulum sp. PH10 TaxID=1187851 RepID=UPI000591775C|nr:cobalt ECF transporter T component CbiQ [Rhodovulum sp. PH10]